MSGHCHVLTLPLSRRRRFQRQTPTLMRRRPKIAIIARKMTQENSTPFARASNCSSTSAGAQLKSKRVAGVGQKSADGRTALDQSLGIRAWAGV